MATLKQTEANRRNSQKSTGPRTEQGKAASRFNALKSGIDAKSQVIPGEEPAELETLTDEYHREWQPATPLERFLVDALIYADWQLRRLRRVEAQLWIDEIGDAKSSYHGLKQDAPLGQVFNRGRDAFTRLQRRIDSTERSYYRALQQLQRLRTGDAPQPDQEPPDSDPLPPPQPSENPDASADLASFLHLPSGPEPSDLSAPPATPHPR